MPTIRVYRSFCDSYFYKQEFVLLQNILPIMLALCSMLSGTYYAHNYASIIGGSLPLIILTNTHLLTDAITILAAKFKNHIQVKMLFLIDTRHLIIIFCIWPNN